MSGYSPTHGTEDNLYRGKVKRTYKRHLKRPDGSWDYSKTEDHEEIYFVGPYMKVGPIKSYITRNRNAENKMELLEIQRSTGWEVVE